jgi:hypothetical protein
MITVEQRISHQDEIEVVRGCEVEFILWSIC